MKAFKEKIILAHLSIALFLFVMSKSFSSKLRLKSILWSWFISTKIKKSMLVNYYNVDKATFRKWIQYFCSDIITDFETYKKNRTISLFESLQIIDRLGIKNSDKLLTKETIIKMSDGNYRSLRESIHQYPRSFGITIEAYAKLRIFPPNISQKILEQYK